MFSSLEQPSDMVLNSMTGISTLFAVLAVASAIAWIYYVEVAVRNKDIGGSGGNDSALDTVDIMFQGAVVAVLFYFGFRHHFRSHY